MSQTTTITPYDAETQRQLAEDESRCAAAAQRSRDERRASRLRTGRVTLTARQMAPLVTAAETLGYRVASGTSRAFEASSSVELSRGREMLVIHRTASGKLVLESKRSPEEVRRVVNQHVRERAVAHLKSRGMEVRTRTLPSGEVQIEGRERGERRGDGAALVTAAVRSDGILDVDVDCVVGNRCEDIATELARAVDGERTATTRKRSFFQTVTPAQGRLRV